MGASFHDPSLFRLGLIIKKKTRPAATKTRTTTNSRTEMANKAKTSKAAAATFCWLHRALLKALKEERSKNNKVLMPGKSLHEVPHVSKRKYFRLSSCRKSVRICRVPRCFRFSDKKGIPI